MKSLRELVKNWLGVYDLTDLRVGAHCGCCGKWIPEVIVEKNYSWGLCNDCENMARDSDGNIRAGIMPEKPWPRPSDKRIVNENEDSWLDGIEDAKRLHEDSDDDLENEQIWF